MAEGKKTIKEVKKPKKAIEPDEAETPAVKPASETKPKAAAKAGKRSTKAVKAAEEKVAKESRKKLADDAESGEKKPTVEQKPPRSREERAGKKYREAAKQIDKTKTYNLAEAVDLATKTSPVKFDATVEMHFNLAVDPKQADQNVRDSVVMPHGTGRSVRIAVFADAADAEKAKKAGAEITGTDTITAALDKEQLDFDVLIAAPALMPKLGKYARLLGPRGMMPNPKSGTVTADVAKAVQEAKAGKVEYRVDQSGIVHIAIGKVSFGPQKLLENAQAIVSSVRAAKPASVKGIYVKSVFVSSTMGPSIKAEV
jgi:large subunit ribosomal protein L1